MDDAFFASLIVVSVQPVSPLPQANPGVLRANHAIVSTIVRMNPLQIRLLSFVMFAGFCGTLTYWSTVLSARPPAPPSAAAVAPSVSLEAGTTLFGGKLTPDMDRSITLSGILSLNEGAAAIVSIDDEPPHAISLGGKLGQDGKLAEVRARSIVIDRNGVRSEIFLPSNTSGAPTIYVR